MRRREPFAVDGQVASFGSVDEDAVELKSFGIGGKQDVRWRVDARRFSRRYRDSPGRGPDHHDFPDPKVPKAVPFGVYDVTDNAGWVTVGTSADTAEFAVETIGQWWRKMGSERYPDATRLLITADAGGSNSYRTRLWKAKIAEFALETGIDVTVCHYPPGTSKWNKIEHRLFSHITINWRGRPLESHEVVVNLIAATTTRTGLRVQAELSEIRDGRQSH